MLNKDYPAASGNQLDLPLVRVCIGLQYPQSFLGCVPLMLELSTVFERGWVRRMERAGVLAGVV